MIGRGRQKINERWPGYGDLLPEDCLNNAGHNWPHHPIYPHPSAIFVGLDPALDQRLVRDKRDKDIALCQTLAAVPVVNQQEFYELYLVDPADARHWLLLPRWKRPIRKGNTDDQQIWKFFTIQRLCMEQAANPEAAAWPMASQGAQLPQTFGVIRYLTPAGLQKLVDVMGSYGTMLQYGRDLGDVTKKPWDEKPT